MNDGLTLLRPDDHLMILSETDASPMHVGALLLFDKVPDSFAATIRKQFEQRLSGTPLLVKLVEAPDGYDSDVWADLATCDLDYHVSQISTPMDASHLHAAVARLSMQRLDLSRPPFRAFVFDGMTDGGAVYLKTHHALADGIGFQEILRRLSDAEPPSPPRSADATLPDAKAWRAAADARFAALADAAAAHSIQRRTAFGELERHKSNPETARARTPVLKLSGPTTTLRNLATFSVSLSRVKAIGSKLHGTINDIFLAICATAIRETLVGIDDLPEVPVVANSARSFRRAEHGPFGNRIVALHPHLATHITDPIARLREIQASMANERARTHLDEAILGAPERPYGPRDRRAKFADRTVDGARRLPGNVTLSNVPGLSEPLKFGGMMLAANYPVPIVGIGRFLNITSRRHGAMLDMGVMTDAGRLPDAQAIVGRLLTALALYESLADD